MGRWYLARSYINADGPPGSWEILAIIFLLAFAPLFILWWFGKTIAGIVMPFWDWVVLGVYLIFAGIITQIAYYKAQNASEDQDPIGQKVIYRGILWLVLFPSIIIVMPFFIYSICWSREFEIAARTIQVLGVYYFYSLSWVLITHSTRNRLAEALRLVAVFASAMTLFYGFWPPNFDFPIEAMISIAPYGEWDIWFFAAGSVQAGTAILAGVADSLSNYLPRFGAKQITGTGQDEKTPSDSPKT